MEIKNNSPLVSIIVPVYNAERYLSDCAESLLGQTYKNIEIILVNDGSTDKSLQLCETFAKKDSRVRIIHKENSGAALSREIGIKESNGEYICFVDSDDWLDKEAVSECVASAEENQSDCVLFSYVKEYPNISKQVQLFGEDFSYDVNTSEKKIHRRIVGLDKEELKNPQRIDSLSTFWGKLYRKGTAMQGKIVSEKTVGTSEDTVFNLYALEDCRISYTNKCFYHYRKSNSESLTGGYKVDLADKWDSLYELLSEYIKCSGKYEVYRGPFLNRVACGMIALGLNEIQSNKNLIEKARALNSILCKPLYIEALKQFDTSYCDVKWKLFFNLCKNRKTILLTLLLQVMNSLRAHYA